MANTGAYILYHDLTSVCSIMARYTYAIRGDPADSNTGMQINDRVCELKSGEQLTENFLCNVNTKGEVPVLVPVGPDDGNEQPIPDSVDITYFIASRYPSLLPEQHQTEAKRLISALHDINFFSLTFAGKPESQQRNTADLETRLEQDISERYRKAIEYKIQRIRSRKLDALEPPNIQIAIDSTKKYLAEIAQLLGQSNTGWILNTAKPTALDAHVIVFICRLQDVHRDTLIPEKVVRYAEVGMAQTEWKETMRGRRTMGPPSS